MRRAIRLSVSKFPAVPTHRKFAFALFSGLLSLPLPYSPKASLSSPLDFFPLALVHGIDFHGVIVSKTVSNWVPMPLAHVVPDERAPDSGPRGCRTKNQLHLRPQRGIQRCYQNADQNAVSKDLFRGSRVFGNVVLPNLELVNKLSPPRKCGSITLFKSARLIFSNCWLVPQAESSPFFESGSAMLPTMCTATSDVAVLA